MARSGGSSQPGGVALASAPTATASSSSLYAGSTAVAVSARTAS